MLLGSNWPTRILSACTAIPLAGVEYYSQSKGGWMAIGAAVIFILAVGFPRLRGLLYAAFIGVLGIIGAYIAGKIPSSAIDPILTKIGVINISFTNPSPDNYANSERVAHWIAGIHMFQDHPLLGRWDWKLSRRLLCISSRHLCGSIRARTQLLHQYSCRSRATRPDHLYVVLTNGLCCWPPRLSSN